MKDFYGKIFKSSKKDIKEDNRRWKDIPSSQIDKNDIGKISILPKSIYRFKTISINISAPPPKKNSLWTLKGQLSASYRKRTNKENNNKKPHKT